MDERLERIAEKSFKEAMNEFSYFGDIGVALKNIQNEIRDVSGRTRRIERTLGNPWNYGLLPDDSSKKNSLNVTPIVKHISCYQIKRIRLRKKLKIWQMAQLLNVSNHKYIEWERGNVLMAPWVEEEILRLSKIKGKDLLATFSQEEKKQNTKQEQQKITNISKAPPIVTREEFKYICKILQLSYRQLALTLGVKHSTLNNWISKQIHPSEEIGEKIQKLLEKAKKISPQIEITPPSSIDTKEQISKNIQQMLDYLHWTHRELAQYLHTKTYMILNWLKCYSTPRPNYMNKIRRLHKSIEAGDIGPEHVGELATPAELISLQKKLNWSNTWLGRELHINIARIKALENGSKMITYRDTVKIRNLQNKLAMGEIKPYVETPRIPGYLIKEICTIYRLTHYELSKILGCSEGIITDWIHERKFPCNVFNDKLWHLWNNAPKDTTQELTANEIYGFRRSLRMTQKEFAKMLNVGACTIYDWEHERRQPNLKISDKIRDICMGKIAQKEEPQKGSTLMEEL